MHSTRSWHLTWHSAGLSISYLYGFCTYAFLALCLVKQSKTCDMKILVSYCFPSNYIPHYYLCVWFTFTTSNFTSSITWNIMARRCWMIFGIWTGLDIRIAPSSIVPVIFITVILLTFRSLSILVTFPNTRTFCWNKVKNDFGVWKNLEIKQWFYIVRIFRFE